MLLVDALDAVSVTVYVPGAEYACAGCCDVDVAPSPNDQLQCVGLPRDWSVKETFVPVETVCADRSNAAMTVGVTGTVDCVTVTVFVVDTKSPGYSCTPIETIGGIRTNTTYYDNVRVPASRLVAGEGKGWTLIVNQLKYERVSLMSAGLIERLFHETVELTRTARTPDGQRPIDRPWVRLNLARAEAKIEILKLLNWRQAWNVTNGTFDYAEASTVKVYGSELYIEVYGLLLECVGQAGYLKRGTPGHVVRGRLERMYRSMLILTFGGGTNEIQRDIIAVAGLGMPRPLR